jgi:hypothetical protein
MVQFYQAALATTAAAPIPSAPASAPAETPKPASTAMPPAVMERPLSRHLLPPELRKMAPAPPMSAEELRVEIERKLREGDEQRRAAGS